MGRLDAGAAGRLQPPNPRDPAAFPVAFCIPSPNWEPHSPRLIAPSCSFFLGAVVLNGITVCRGRAGVPARATCRQRRFKAKPNPSWDAGRQGRPCMFPGSVSSCNLVKWSGSISPCFSLPFNSQLKHQISFPRLPGSSDGSTLPGFSGNKKKTSRAMGGNATTSHLLQSFWDEFAPSCLCSAKEQRHRFFALNSQLEVAPGCMKIRVKWGDMPGNTAGKPGD